MTTKYAIYDFQTGENVIYDDKELALQAFWSSVISLAKSYFHDTAYMTVEYKEDGSEIWRKDDNQEIDRPRTSAEIEEILERYKLKELEITKVETMP